MKMLIGGRPTEASDGRVVDVLNPATQEVLDTVPAATEQDIDAALANALRGAQAWGAVPLHRRLEVLHGFLERFDNARESLWKLLQSETGKTVGAARGCIDGSLELGTHYLEIARTLGGETFPIANSPATENDLLLTIREPLGVVVVILPFNFPIDAYMHKVIPALAMGNAVIIKPASDTPLTDIQCTQMLLDAGVPGDAAQIVTGSGAKIGGWLTGDSRVDLINLTGSTAVGMEIAQRSAAHLHRLHLELGGNDAFIILPDADLEQAVDAAFQSRIGNAGQVCCAGKRFLVHREMMDAFCGKLAERLTAVRIGDPSDPAVECGPLISIRAAEELERQLAHCVGQGAGIDCGGKRIKDAYFEPTLMRITPAVDAAGDLELFGPVWSVLGYDTVEEAVRYANQSIYGLSAGVMGKDMGTMMRVCRAIKAGGCVVNGSGAYRSSDQPFGGYKMSGLGREGGKYSLEEMSQLKTIVLRGV